MKSYPHLFQNSVSDFLFVKINADIYYSRFQFRSRTSAIIIFFVNFSVLHIYVEIFNKVVPVLLQMHNEKMRQVLIIATNAATIPQILLGGVAKVDLPNINFAATNDFAALFFKMLWCLCTYVGVGYVAINRLHLLVGCGPIFPIGRTTTSVPLWWLIGILAENSLSKKSKITVNSTFYTFGIYLWRN